MSENSSTPPIQLTLVPNWDEHERSFTPETISTFCVVCGAEMAQFALAVESVGMNAGARAFSYYHRGCLAALISTAAPMHDLLGTVAPLDLAALPTLHPTEEQVAAYIKYFLPDGIGSDHARELLGYGWSAHRVGYQLPELLTARSWDVAERKILVEGWRMAMKSIELAIEEGAAADHKDETEEGDFRIALEYREFVNAMGQKVCEISSADLDMVGTDAVQAVGDTWVKARTEAASAFADWLNEYGYWSSEDGEHDGGL